MNTYTSPLVSRGTSNEIAAIWSEEYKFKLWRQLWVALADAQKTLGLPITSEQINALKTALDEPIDLELAARYESDLHHDVMAHIKTFGDHVPIAKGIIHLGATSQYVVDNADSVRIKESTYIIIKKLSGLIMDMSEIAAINKSIPTLGFYTPTTSPNQLL
jgi:adenylosuccinate lyase